MKTTSTFLPTDTTFSEFFDALAIWIFTNAFIHLLSQKFSLKLLNSLFIVIRDIEKGNYTAKGMYTIY
jgi:hypothetical protein